MLRPILVFSLAVLALSACQKRTHPPGDPKVCYHVVRDEQGQLKYNRLGAPQPSMEHCAAALEAMRIKFLTLGGSNRSLTGAYQGNFLFLQREGIFTAQTLEGHRYLALVRTGDGRLAVPGAMPQ